MYLPGQDLPPFISSSPWVPAFLSWVSGQSSVFITCILPSYTSWNLYFLNHYTWWITSYTWCFPPLPILTHGTSHPYTWWSPNFSFFLTHDDPSTYHPYTRWCSTNNVPNLLPPVHYNHPNLLHRQCQFNWCRGSGSNTKDTKWMLEVQSRLSCLFLFWCCLRHLTLLHCLRARPSLITLN